MLATNFSRDSYVFDAIETRAGEAQFEFTDSPLATMIMHLGVAAPKEGPSDRTIEAGRSILIFFMLDLGGNKAPIAIEHSLRVLDDKGGAHDVVLAPLPVSNESPIVVGPPLRGEWISGDSVNNGPDADHRRAVMILGGHPWLAQRYAIDWVQIQTVDGVRTTWKGPERNNDSYFCYDQPIYSVAAGKVVDMADGLPENVPHSGTFAYPIDLTMSPEIASSSRSRRIVMYSTRICGRAPCASRLARRSAVVTWSVMSAILAARASRIFICISTVSPHFSPATACHTNLRSSTGAGRSRPL
jgi:hypothetical protein